MRPCYRSVMLRPLAETMYAEISDFLTGPRVYDLSLADARDLEQVQRLEIYPAMQHGPDISRERWADLSSRLVLLGKVARRTEPVAAEAVARG